MLRPIVLATFAGFSAGVDYRSVRVGQDLALRLVTSHKHDNTPTS